MAIAHTTIRSLIIAAGILAVATNVWAEDRDGDRPTTTKRTKKGKHFYNSYLGKQPPELTGASEHWVNQSSQVTLKQLHGRVVWLEFNF